MGTRLPRHFANAAIFIAIGGLLSSCSKKGDSEDGIPLGDSSTIESSTTSGGSTPSNVTLSPQLDGLPATVSAAASLSVTVQGDLIQQYRYSLMAGALDCGGASYGEWTPVTVSISEDLGSDGAKILCLMVSGTSNEGAMLVGSTSYQWIKDTVGPVINANALSGFGPYYTLGNQTIFSGDAVDATAGIASVSASLQLSEGGCLNSAGTSFDAACPTYHALTVNGQGQWSMTTADSVFVSSSTYQLTVQAVDQAGNPQTVALSQVWDTTPPSSPTNLVITEGREQQTLAWVAGAGANSYVVVRRAAQAVSEEPEEGINYTSGQSLNSEHAIAYAGPALSFVDTGLAPYVRYYYAVYSRDAAGNLSGPATGNGFTAELPRFRGIQYAAMVSPNKTMVVEWQPFNDGVISADSLTYELYVATTSGGQNFATAPAASQLGGSRIYYQYGGNASTIYLVLRARKPSGEVDNNTREFPLRVAGGAHHKIAHSNRNDGNTTLGPSGAYLNNGAAIERDNWGNVLFGADMGVLNVLCAESTQAPYCLGRTVNRVYTIAGTDGRGSTTANIPAARAAMGQIVSLAVDSYGNVFVGDATNFMVRALCFAPIAPGFCNAKTPGHHYVVTGTGSAADGITNILAGISQIGAPNALAFDSAGNLYIGDTGYRRLRVICFEATSGPCNGQTIGNIYRYVGTGALADGADNTLADTALGLGDFGDMRFDAGNNLYIADTNYRRVRVICRSIGANQGFCTGKTAGNHYRIMGTGAAANGGDDVVAATAGIGQSFGIDIDSQRNIYLSDITYFRIRVICQSNSGSGYCSDKVIGNTYHYAGTGVNTTGGTDGTHRALAGVGDPRGIIFDGSDNLLVVDSRFKYLRLLCGDAGSSGLCSDKTPSYHYLHLGSGNSTAGAEYVHSLYNAVGSMTGVAIDPNGNVYLADNVNFRLRVICYNLDAYPCQGKTFAYSYFVAGTGVTGDGTDGSAVIRAIGAVFGIASDSQGNIYMGDTTNRRVRVLCQNTSFGFCSGKTRGYTYRIAGTGVGADGVSNAVAASTAMGMPYDLAVDSYGNIFAADNNYRRIRGVCVSTSGYCTGKTIGNVYHVAGTGTSGDGADNSVATATDMGSVTAIALDAQENVYLADALFRIRVVCNNTSGGYCSGKTAGNVYRYAGTGVTGNGADNTVAASSAIGSTLALAFDPQQNLYLADATNFYIRAICQTVNSGGFCQDKTAGNTYRMFGTGANFEGESNLLGSAVNLGAGGNGGLKFTAAGHLLRTDAYNSLRIFYKP